MIKISHRGNLHGPNPALENQKNYIERALEAGYHVEVDLWFLNSEFYLGHDFGQYKIDIEFLKNENIWVHCKNIDALLNVRSTDDIHYFWHETDTVTLTSKGYIWAFPGKQPIQNSIAVLPELYSDSLEKCSGICSDFIINY